MSDPYVAELVSKAKRFQVAFEIDMGKGKGLASSRPLIEALANAPRLSDDRWKALIDLLYAAAQVH